VTEPAAAPVAPATTTALLEIAGLDAFYGKARVLDDLSFTMERGSLAIVGRNGMGKTTLCNAIMGIAPPHATGSIRFEGKELVGGQSHKIARHGIGYVPQGRRLFPSLTVDEHLRIAARSSAGAQTGGEWTRDRVYELFPRLAERKRNGGAQLSGGEQQMLAIGRALVTNPRLVVMDEPTEGLAPLIVEQVTQSLRRLAGESEISVLLIEQNLGVATSLAERQLIMVAGSIATETTAAVLAGDSELQRRYLGVEPLAH
jgi:branched-chain amino acid transport system ATP-binding protein